MEVLFWVLEIRGNKKRTHQAGSLNLPAKYIASEQASCIFLILPLVFESILPH